MTQTRVFLAVLFSLFTLIPPLHAQDRVWVQIEAQPTLREGQERARAYAALFPDVAGFRLGSGWYGIVLGPYSAEAGAERLIALRRENLIPRDSFVNDGANLREPFWPVGQTAPAVTPPADPATDPATDPVADPAAGATPEVTLPEVTLPDATLPDATPPETAGIVPEPAPEPVVVPDETRAEARASEAALERPTREALQTALKWFGHYGAAIDGQFGPGTRNSMAAWQEAQGYEATGVLTTMQRGALLTAFEQERRAFGFELVTEPESGIEIMLPMAMVEFDHYEPPFVHYRGKDGSDVRVILISQPGDQGALYGLYDILQTLEVMPLTGERERRERSFTITGESAAVRTHAYAELSQGLIKGYLLSWNPRTATRMDRVLAAMQETFRGVGDRALDPGLVPMSDDARRGLLSGLEVRKPRMSRTGFFIDRAGTVLTTTEAVDQCARITIEGETEADVRLSDTGLGIAVLAPRSPVAPPAVAEFQLVPDRIGAEVAVAGYSYEDALPAPVLTYGALEATEGLAGEPDLKRLSLATLPGDAGGPVIDATGAVLGMLLPRDANATRQLPEGVAFAAAAATIATRLTAAGITPTQSEKQGALAPEDLTRAATRMTVLVSCWD